MSDSERLRSPGFSVRFEKGSSSEGTISVDPGVFWVSSIEKVELRGRSIAGFGCPNRKVSPTFHAKNDVKNGNCHANFTLLGLEPCSYTL